MAINFSPLLNMLSRYRTTTETTTETAKVDLSVNVVASADAYGEDTLANATLNLTVLDRGLTSFAYGTTSVTAAAQSPDPGAAYAITSTAVDIVGADFIQMDWFAGTTWDENGMVDVQTSTFAAMNTHFVAAVIMDVEGNTIDAPSIGNMSGNVADFSASVTATGTNTFVDLLADAIAMEDTFSSTVVTATAASVNEVNYQVATGSRWIDLMVTDDRMTLVKAGAGIDLIATGGGDDWIFARQGNDIATAGKGDDNVFGGSGNDWLEGADGADWMFGGSGNDELLGQAGNDMLFGDAGNDRMDGGDGDDLLVGGGGRDRVTGGKGEDFFRLGAAGGDDIDTYTGGKGADVYAIVDRFDQDTITDFSLAEGDMLLLPSLFETARDNGQEPFVMSREGRGGADLVMEFSYLAGQSVLTLANFFTTNPLFSDVPRRGDLSAADLDRVLDAIATPIAAAPELANDLNLAMLGDQVTLLG